MTTSNKLPVIVYTTPSCFQCKMTKKYLSDKDIQYKEVDLALDEIALQRVKSMGFAQAPIVEVPHDRSVATTVWSGFNPSLLNQLLTT